MLVLTPFKDGEKRSASETVKVPVPFVRSTSAGRIEEESVLVKCTGSP